MAAFAIGGVAAGAVGLHLPADAYPPNSGGGYYENCEWVGFSGTDDMPAGKYYAITHSARTGSPWDPDCGAQVQVYCDDTNGSKFAAGNYHYAQHSSCDLGSYKSTTHKQKTFTGYPSFTIT